MSFLNEEQADLIKVVADFAKKEIAPNAAHYDETEEFPWDDILYRKAWEALKPIR